MSEPNPTRRRFLGSAALAPLAVAAPAHAATGDTDTFTYEITRTEEEWRALLDDDQAYYVLREGGTEVPHSSLNAFEEREGTYACRGCDLTVFESKWKKSLFEIGWAFFHQACENAVLTSTDIFTGMDDGDRDPVIEAHCRRCGSHLGHILLVRGEVLHCINGSALEFTPAA